MTHKTRGLKPGEKAPCSAQYGISGTKLERTVAKNETLPPTPRRGQTYFVKDRTRTS